MSFHGPSENRSFDSTVGTEDNASRAAGATVEGQASPRCGTSAGFATLAPRQREVAPVLRALLQLDEFCVRVANCAGAGADDARRGYADLRRGLEIAVQWCESEARFGILSRAAASCFRPAMVAALRRLPPKVPAESVWLMIEKVRRDIGEAIAACQRECENALH